MNGFIEEKKEKRSLLEVIYFCIFILVFVFSTVLHASDRSEIIETENVARRLVKMFFSDTGLKIGTVISLALSILFFFRVRNYVMSIVFYVIANILVFLGYKISNMLFK